MVVKHKNWQEQFDVTMACAVLMHVDDLTQAMNELLRVTCHGGHILIYDLNKNIATAQFIAKQQKHILIKPRDAVMKNMFGTIIRKQ